MKKNDRFVRAMRQVHLRNKWDYQTGTYWCIKDSVENEFAELEWDEEEHQWMCEVCGEDLMEWEGNPGHISREHLTYDIEVACPQYDWKWDCEQGRWEYERSYAENESWNRRADSYEDAYWYDDYYDDAAYNEQRAWEEEQQLREEFEYPEDMKCLDDLFDAYYAAEDEYYARECESVNSYGMPIEEEGDVEFEYERRRECESTGGRKGIRQHLKENEEMYSSRYNERREPVDYAYINDRIERGVRRGEKWDDVQSELLLKAENWREKRYIREDAVELNHEVGNDGRLYVRRFCGGEMMKGAVYVNADGVLCKYGERRRWKRPKDAPVTEWRVSSTVVLAKRPEGYFKYIYAAVEYATLYGLEGPPGRYPAFFGWSGYKRIQELQRNSEYVWYKLVTKKVTVSTYDAIRGAPDAPAQGMRCVAKRQVSKKEALRLIASANGGAESNGVCKHTGRRIVKMKVGDNSPLPSSRDVQLEYVEPLRYYSPPSW